MNVTVRVRLLFFIVLASTAVLAIAGTAVAAVPGAHRWADAPARGNGWDYATAVAVNAAGCPIVAGQQVSNPGGSGDIVCRSYLPDGTLRWQATWDGGGDDSVAGVVVDKTNNCAYVAGTCASADGDSDFVILKVSDADGEGFASGDILWAKTYDAPASRNDAADGIARDSYGNIYLVGSSQRSDGSWDLLLLKYDANGELVWTKRHDNGGARRDVGRAIVAYGSNVFVAGTSARPGHGDDTVLIRYTLGGSRTWVRYYDGPRHRSELVSDLAANSNSIYLCGAGASSSSANADAMLVRYGYDGTLRWVRYGAGSGADQDEWRDVAVDNKSRVHVTGYMIRRSTEFDMVTRLYDSSGSRLWERVYATAGTDMASALAVDSSRCTYVCGKRASGNIVVVKYGTSGATLWSTTYPNPSQYPGEAEAGSDWPEGIALGGENAYVVGGQTVDQGGKDAGGFLTLAIWR